MHLLRDPSQVCVYFIIFTCIGLPDHVIVTLPSLSPTMETGNVVSWAKNVGDQVDEGDLLAEIETDKATMSMDCCSVGYIAKILVPAGTKNIPIGTVGVISFIKLFVAYF